MRLNTKAKFVPLEAAGNSGPDFVFFAGFVEIGAPAWKQTSQEDAPASRSSWTIRASRLRSMPPSTGTARPGECSLIWARSQVK